LEKVGVARDEATTAEKVEAGAPTLTATPAPRRFPAGGIRAWRWPLMIGGPLLLLAIAAYFILTGGKSQSTDDAYVQAARVPVSASIGGRVIELDVHENQPVKAGQVLFRLDTRDIAAGAAQAEAQVAASKLQVEALQAGYQQQLAALKTASGNVAFTQHEAARQKALMAAGVASRDQYEIALHNADLAQESVATAQQQVAQALANLGGARVTPANHPTVLQAEAALQRAKLNLSYGTVVAAQDGVVTRVEQLQVGSYVNPAQTLFWLVAGQPWVEANFKEDQLAKMRVGQPARIHVDACPGSDFQARVASFSPGSGEAFSPLPAQNATGNWVKVVQRLPVRLAFDKPPPDVCGAAGLSANVTVDVRSGSARRAPAQP
jgi:membrane fusion protein (multidrug efflux system)